MFNVIANTLKAVGEALSQKSPTDDPDNTTSENTIEPMDVFLPKPFRSFVSQSFRVAGLLFQEIPKIEEAGQEVTALLEDYVKASEEFKYLKKDMLSRKMKEITENSPWDFKKAVYDFYVTKMDDSTIVNTGVLSPLSVAPSEEWTPFFREVKKNIGSNFSEYSALNHMMFNFAYELSNNPQTRNSKVAEEFLDFCFELYGDLSADPGFIFYNRMERDLSENAMQYAAYFGDPRVLDKAIGMIGQYLLSSQVDEGKLQGIQGAALAVDSFRSTNPKLMHKRDYVLDSIKRSDKIPEILKEKLEN